MDEFNEVTKLVAFPNCVTKTGLKFAIENGQEELADLEIEIDCRKDENNQFYYEALVPELSANEQVKAEWHTHFTPELVMEGA